MSPGALRAARKRMRMSQDQFAAALGFMGRTRFQTIWRYESGRSPIPKAVEITTKLLLKDWERPGK
jgi:transcriptional regulator with XRE-family HTH domain